MPIVHYLRLSSEHRYKSPLNLGGVQMLVRARIQASSTSPVVCVTSEATSSGVGYGQDHHRITTQTVRDVLDSARSQCHPRPPRGPLQWAVRSMLGEALQGLMISTTMSRNPPGHLGQTN